jgi:hypothetical protein
MGLDVDSWTYRAQISRNFWSCCEAVECWMCLIIELACCLDDLLRNGLGTVYIESPDKLDESR